MERTLYGRDGLQLRKRNGDRHMGNDWDACVQSADVPRFGTVLSIAERVVIAPDRETNLARNLGE